MATDAATAMKQALADMKKNYAGARQQMKTLGEKVPDGEYIARISGNKFHLSATSGKLSIMRTFSVLEGESQGMSQTDFMSLGNEVGLAIAMKYLDTLGYEVPDSVDDWEPVIVDIKTNMPIVKIRIRTQDGSDFTNVDVLEVIESSSTATDIHEVVEEIEEEEEPLEEEGDELDELDRSALKKILVAEGVEFKVYQSTTDDAIRNAIRAAR